uniref:(northern house mosquito) hypothetical protein n=1 Tax=Culex pipiens TaxID=7175 RepID=A0A8D8NBC0_CULPI
MANRATGFAMDLSATGAGAGAVPNVQATACGAEKDCGWADPKAVPPLPPKSPPPPPSGGQAAGARTGFPPNRHGLGGGMHPPANGLCAGGWNRTGAYALSFAAHSLLIAISSACSSFKPSPSSQSRSNTWPARSPVTNLSTRTCSKLVPNLQSTDSRFSRPYHCVAFSWFSCRAL